MRERVIFHIDVNNAFLSWTAIKLLNEGYDIDIRTIPSVISGDESIRHGIVLAKSPVAKEYGIVTAETTYSARRKCKDLKTFPADMNFYKEMSRKLVEYLSNFTPQIEQFSIDECFLDMSHTKFLYKDLINLAYSIKGYIKENFGFTVNIGIANNKLCAKMASDFQKPDRVHTLFKEEISKKLWPLSVGELFMIGKKTKEKLNDLDIKTIGELANTDINLLKKHFKSQGTMMWEYANGIDESKVESNQEKNKCISVSETLPKDIDDIDKLKKILLRQSEEVGRQLRNQESYARTVAVTLKTNEFKSYSKQMKFENPTNNSSDIYKLSEIILEQCYMEEAIRNIGIRLSDFTSDRNFQVSFFEKNDVKKEDLIQKTVDEINNKFGTNVIMKAALLEKEKKE